jgi:hypothetical protein
VGNSVIFVSHLSMLARLTQNTLLIVNEVKSKKKAVAWVDYCDSHLSSSFRQRRTRSFGDNLYFGIKRAREKKLRKESNLKRDQETPQWH